MNRVSFTKDVSSSEDSDNSSDNLTIRDDVSWAELAFGQSMKSLSGSFVEQSNRHNKPGKKVINQRASGLGKEDDAYANKTGVASPVFASFAHVATSSKRKPPLQDTAAEQEVVVQWIEGTESDLRQKLQENAVEENKVGEVE